MNAQYAAKISKLSILLACVLLAGARSRDAANQGSRKDLCTPPRPRRSGARTAHLALRQSPVVIIVERNLGFEAEHLFRYCRTIPSSYFLYEKGAQRIGILTTQTFKLAYVSFANILLRDERLICMEDKNFVDYGRSKSREALLDQLSFFGFTFSRPENHFQKQRFVIGGKAGGGKDDLAMSFLFGVYFSLDERYTFRSGI